MAASTAPAVTSSQRQRTVSGVGSAARPGRGSKRSARTAAKPASFRARRAAQVAAPAGAALPWPRGAGAGQRELALGPGEVGAADPGRLAGHVHARRRTCACRRRGPPRRRRARSRARGPARRRQEPVGGADGVDLERALASRARRPVGRGRRDRRRAHAILALGAHEHVAPGDPRHPGAVARVVDQPPGVGGHARRGAQPVAAPGGLGHRHDLGAARRELLGHRQQERARAGQQDAAAGQHALALGQRLRGPRRHRARERPAGEGDRRGRRRPWPARRPARARAARRPVSSSVSRVGRRPDGRAREQESTVEARQLARTPARRARQRGRQASPASSKRRRQICPPGAAYSSISATEAPARRAATAAAIPAGPPPTTTTSTCSSARVERPSRSQYRQSSTLRAVIRDLPELPEVRQLMPASWRSSSHRLVGASGQPRRRPAAAAADAGTTGRRRADGVDASRSRGPGRCRTGYADVVVARRTRFSGAGACRTPARCPGTSPRRRSLGQRAARAPAARPRIASTRRRRRTARPAGSATASAPAPSCRRAARRENGGAGRRGRTSRPGHRRGACPPPSRRPPQPASASASTSQRAPHPSTTIARRHLQRERQRAPLRQHAAGSGRRRVTATCTLNRQVVGCAVDARVAR